MMMMSRVFIQTRDLIDSKAGYDVRKYLVFSYNFLSRRSGRFFMQFLRVCDVMVLVFAVVAFLGMSGMTL